MDSINKKINIILWQFPSIIWGINVLAYQYGMFYREFDNEAI
mgnify:CR=1 FL=1